MRSSIHETAWRLFPLARCDKTSYAIKDLKVPLSLDSYIFFTTRFNVSHYFIIMDSFLHCVSLLIWGSLFGGHVQGLSSWQTKLRVGFSLFYFLLYSANALLLLLTLIVYLH